MTLKHFSRSTLFVLYLLYPMVGFADLSATPIDTNSGEIKTISDTPSQIITPSLVLDPLLQPGLMQGYGYSKSNADAIFANARPRILQVQTVIKDAAKKTSTGSAFLVSADGFAVTNYHVVSQYVFDPDIYQIEYRMPDNSVGKLTLYAIDVVNDLAVVKLDKPATTFFSFNERALNDQLVEGETLYAMGVPADLDFSIVDGTYNGLVQGSLLPRIHFTGAINAGMSGGPAITADSTIVGINVARSISAQLVSFLVPAKKAYELVLKAKQLGNTPPTPEILKKDIGQQLYAWQEQWTETILKAPPQFSQLGPYRIKSYDFDWTNCSARTNEENRIKPPRFLVTTNFCSGKNSLFINMRQSGNFFESIVSYVKNRDLNSLAFAAQLMKLAYFPSDQYGNADLTPNRCHEGFIKAKNTDDKTHPKLFAVTCLQAYRDFEDLYDYSIVVFSQDSSNENTIATLELNVISYEKAIKISRNFLDSIEVIR